MLGVCSASSSAFGADSPATWVWLTEQGVGRSNTAWGLLAVSLPAVVDIYIYIYVLFAFGLRTDVCGGD